MQFWRGLIKIIFVLATIVTVTDCCSSRILMLREHALKNFVEKRQQQQSQSQQRQQQQEQKLQQEELSYQEELQHEIEAEVANIIKQMELNRTFALEVDRLSSTDPEGERLLDALGIRSRHKPATEPATTTSTTTTSTTTTTTTTTPPATTLATEVPPAVFTPAILARAELSEEDPTRKHTGDSFSRECGADHVHAFCMNGGFCVRYPVGEQNIYSCICAEGFVGERCEAKSSIGSFFTPPPDYYPKRKVALARFTMSFPLILLCSVVYVTFAGFIILRRQQSKELLLVEQSSPHRRDEFFATDLFASS